MSIRPRLQVIVTLRKLVTAIFISVITGCSTVPKQPEIWPADRYYNEARQAQSSGDYPTAINYFSELEVRYPFSPHTQLAPLEIAYAHYKLNEYEAALEAADRFMKYHPSHLSIDYALYLKGLIHFTQAHAAESTIRSEDVNARQSDDLVIEYARASYQDFGNLAQNYPQSQYHDDALKRLEYLRNQLAEHELNIVKQQLQAGNNTEAENRARYIVENYPKSSSAAEALLLTQKEVHISPKTKEMAHISEDDSAIVQPAIKSIRQEDWLLQQAPQNYTIQIAGTSQTRWLEVFIEENHLYKDVAYFKRQLNGKDWYSVVYGNYENRADAYAKVKELKTRLGVTDIWVRQFSQVQATILNSKSASQ